VTTPYCCETPTCLENIDDPNINGLYYMGGITQLQGYYNKFWAATPFPTLNNPTNDYYLARVYTQNAPSWIKFTKCIDLARWQIHLLSVCEFLLPACVESYQRDPYCVVENKAKCDPCADEFEDCCGSSLISVDQAYLIVLYGNRTIYDDCPNCELNEPETCADYPTVECRLNAGGLGGGLTDGIFQLPFEGCAGTATKKCCFRRTYTTTNNQRWYQRYAWDVTISLVGATLCDGTDNNPGGSPPVQEEIDCDYDLTPYGGTFPE
jgi:hypothetical protein